MNMAESQAGRYQDAISLLKLLCIPPSESDTEERETVSQYRLQNVTERQRA